MVRVGISLCLELVYPNEDRFITVLELFDPSIPTTNIVKKLQRATISGLLFLEEVPSFAPLTVNSPLAKGIEIHRRVIQKDQKLADHYK